MKEYAFAKSIGCTIDPKSKYPLTKARFLSRLHEVSQQMALLNRQRMDDPKAGRDVTNVRLAPFHY